MNQSKNLPIYRGFALFLFIIFQVIFARAIAHEGHSWSTDYRAFASAKLMPLPVVPIEDPLFAINVDPAFLKQKLSELSGALPTMIDGQSVRISERSSANGRLLARKFLTREYQALGFAVSTQPYKKTLPPQQGENFIAEKVGTDPSKVFIVSSHMDSVVSVAGANDDGSGTIAALAIAKTLSQQSFRYTLRIVAFDQEELGLVGSSFYVPTLNRMQVIGNIHMEMMGTNSRKDGAFHVIDCNRADSMGFSEKIMQGVVSLNLPLQRVAACTDRSDHAHFWKAQIGSVVISENFFGGDGDPCYHKACDIVDARLDFNYMANITKALAYATGQFLQ
ncbi:MAG: M28 family metallopeptidase [Bdellovibrionales bacterium]